MNFFKFLFFYFLFPPKVNSKNFDLFANFIKSIIDDNYSSSVVFLIGGNLTLTKCMYLQKYLCKSDNYYLSSSMKISSFLNNIKYSLGGDEKTIIVAEYNSELFTEQFAKLSQETDISSYKWLIIASSFDIDNFKDLKIPLNSLFWVAHGDMSTGYTLTEIYDVGPERKLSTKVGEWVPERKNHFQIFLRDIFQRRRNLDKSIVKVVSSSEDPCAEASFTLGIAPIVMCIHKRLWDATAEMLNVKTKIIIIPDLQRDTIENANTDITLRSAPLNPVDFKTRSYIWPVLSAKLLVLASYTGQEVDWKTYTRPFNKAMWLVILVWILVCDLTFLLAEFVSWSINKKGNPLSNYSSRFSFLSFFAFCNQGTSESPQKLSYRLILFAVFIVPAVLVPGYSAELTSFITVQIPKMPFKNLQELSLLKDYDLGWHYTFPLKLMFNMNDTSPLNQRLLKNNVLPENRRPKTDIEAVERMCEEKFAFISDISTIVALKPKCQYYKLDHPFRVVFNSMEIKKNNRFEYFFNRCERQIQYTGVQSRIIMQTVIKFIRYPKQQEAREEKASPIMIENGVLPLAVLLIFMGLSLVIFLLEVLWFKHKTKKNVMFNLVFLP